MKRANFKSEDQELQHVFNTANSLSIGSVMEYVGINYTVTGFTKNYVIAQDQNGKVEKFTPIEINGYIDYGFMKLSNK